MARRRRPRRLPRGNIFFPRAPSAPRTSTVIVAAPAASAPRMAAPRVARRRPSGRRGSGNGGSFRGFGLKRALVEAGIELLGGGASAVVDAVTDYTPNKVDENPYLRGGVKVIVGTLAKAFGGSSGKIFGHAWNGDTFGSTVRRVGGRAEQRRADAAKK